MLATQISTVLVRHGTLRSFGRFWRLIIAARCDGSNAETRMHESFIGFVRRSVVVENL